MNPIPSVIRTAAPAAARLLAAALVLTLALGCSQEAKPTGSTPGTAPDASPTPSATEVVAAPEPMAVPVPAVAPGRGVPAPAGSPAAIRDEVEQARMEIETMREEIEGHLREGTPIDAAARKKLEERLKVAEERLQQLIERAEKSGSGGQ